MVWIAAAESFDKGSGCDCFTNRNGVKPYNRTTRDLCQLALRDKTETSSCRQWPSKLEGSVDIEQEQRNEQKDGEYVVGEKEHGSDYNAAGGVSSRSSRNR